MGSPSLGLTAAELTLGRSTTSTFEIEVEAEDVRHNHRKRRSTQQEEFEFEPEEDAASEIHSMNDRSGVQLLGYLKSLEEERRKITALKKELPLCMHLLTAAIKAAKEELPRNNVGVVVGSGGGRSSADPAEEFIPLRRRRRSDGELTRLNLDDDGAPTTGITHDRSACALDPLPGHETTWKTALSILTSEEDSNSNGREAKAEGLCRYDGDEDEEEEGRAAGMCNLQATKTTNFSSPPIILRSRASAFFPYPKVKAVASSGGGTWPSSTPAPHHRHCSSSSRKRRRCWSSELHLKFVNALDQLGGADVATPKLILEIMKVEGLTNDEVKSHLQKYRLHAWKPIAGGSPAAAMLQLSPQLLVVGGISLRPTSLDTSDNCKLPSPWDDAVTARSFCGGGGGAGVSVWERGSCGEILGSSLT